MSTATDKDKLQKVINIGHFYLQMLAGFSK